jgi:hypothetical protein
MEWNEMEPWIGEWKMEKSNDLNGVTRHKHDGSHLCAADSESEITASILWIVARSQLSRSPDELAIG